MRHAPAYPGQEELTVKEKFKELLHDYKKEVFLATHDPASIEDITSECLHITEDVLKQKYHYHFHKLPDAPRAEIINMINNYTREAILPPLVESIVRRQVMQDKRIEALVHLVEHLFECLSHDAQGVPSD
jgi:energy-coupling factor transporter ATP-binding protein EcfA2